MKLEFPYKHYESISPAITARPRSRCCGRVAISYLSPTADANNTGDRK